MKFRVIDNKTGKEADPCKIAREEWVRNLIRLDIEGFALLESGSLVLLDECGNFEYCPSDRFTVVFDVDTKWEKEPCDHFKPAADVVEVVHCKNCAYWDRRWTTGRCESPRNGLIYEYTDEDDYCSYGKKDGAE